MGKPRETFNKKEKEKQKLKKRQEKEEKKLANKANSHKGQSFEDMLAYVDENGNITSTPPDPSKRKEVDQDSIQLGVPRQLDVPQDLVRKGTVTFFNEAKAYGFIKDDNTKESIFVHKQSLIDPIKDNDKVTFEVEKTPKGLKAVDVKLLK